MVHIRVHSLSTHTHFVSPMYLPRVALLHMLHGALLAHVHMYAMCDSIHVNSRVCVVSFYSSLAPVADVSLAALSSSCRSTVFNLVAPPRLDDWSASDHGSTQVYVRTSFWLTRVGCYPHPNDGVAPTPSRLSGRYRSRLLYSLELRVRHGSHHLRGAHAIPRVRATRRHGSRIHVRRTHTHRHLC